MKPAYEAPSKYVPTPETIEHDKAKLDAIRRRADLWNYYERAGKAGSLLAVHIPKGPVDHIVRLSNEVWHCIVVTGVFI